MNNEENLIDDLILSGALEIAGVDSNNGEFLYSITPKMKDVMPDLYKDHMDQVTVGIMRLWENGFVDITLEDIDPVVTLSNKAYDEKELSRLSREDRWALDEIKRLTIR